MKYIYEKVLTLADCENIDEFKIEEIVRCSFKDARYLFRELESYQALQEGKVIDKEALERVAKDFAFKYYRHLSFAMDRVIDALLQDDRFVQMIHDHLAPWFDVNLSFEERQREIGPIRENCCRGYLLNMLAGKFIYQAFMESKESIIEDPYWCDKAKDI